MGKLKKGIHKLNCYIWGSLLGRIMYSKDYFPKGRWFETWKSQGYEWVIPDFWCRVFNNRHRGVRWPVSPYTNVGGANICFHPDNVDNFQSSNTYFQSYDAQIEIGHGTYIAQGVGLITSNHDVYDLDKRSGAANVIIGEKCWVGMNSVILPGVTLGDHTIVGAGSVVTHSFPQGYVIIAGNPAKIIRGLDRKKFQEMRNSSEGCINTE